MKTETKKLIVSDFDDTLFFTENSMNLASKEIIGSQLTRSEIRKLPKELKLRIYGLAFTRYMHLLKPNDELIERYRDYDKRNYKIIILSARGEELRAQTIQMLNEYKIPYAGVILQPDHRISDGAWKAWALGKIIEGSDEVLFFEDKRENIELIKSSAIQKNVEYYLVSKDRITKF